MTTHIIKRELYFLNIIVVIRETAKLSKVAFIGDLESNSRQYQKLKLIDSIFFVTWK